MAGAGHLSPLFERVANVVKSVPESSGSIVWDCCVMAHMETLLDIVTEYKQQVKKSDTLCMETILRAQAKDATADLVWHRLVTLLHATKETDLKLTEHHKRLELKAFFTLPPDRYQTVFVLDHVNRTVYSPACQAVVEQWLRSYRDATPVMYTTWNAAVFNIPDVAKFTDLPLLTREQLIQVINTHFHVQLTEADKAHIGKFAGRPVFFFSDLLSTLCVNLSGCKLRPNDPKFSDKLSEAAKSAFATSVQRISQNFESNKDLAPLLHDRCKPDTKTTSATCWVDWTMTELRYLADRAIICPVGNGSIDMKREYPVWHIIANIKKDDSVTYD